MNEGLIAVRYSRALYSAARDNKCEDAVYKDMSATAAAFAHFPELRHALSSPAITDGEKIRLLKSAAGGKPCKQTQSFIEFVVGKKREDRFGSMARMYEEIYRSEKNIVVSKVTAAGEIDKKTLDSIKKFISGRSGSTVEVRTEIDPEIIGGFILDVEGMRMDASIKGQISKLYKYAGH